MSDRIAMAPDGITWQEFVKNLSRNFFWQISASHYKNSFIQSKTLKFLTKHMAPAGIGWHRLASAAKHIYIIHILTQNLFFYDFFVFFWKIKNLKIKKTKKTHWVKMLYKRWRFTFWFFKKKIFFFKIFWFSLPPLPLAPVPFSWQISWQICWHRHRCQREEREIKKKFQKKKNNKI